MVVPLLNLHPYPLHIWIRCYPTCPIFHTFRVAVRCQQDMTVMVADPCSEWLFTCSQILKLFYIGIMNFVFLPYILPFCYYHNTSTVSLENTAFIFLASVSLFFLLLVASALSLCLVVLSASDGM